MTWLWVILAFLAGWLICWKTMGWLMRKGLRNGTYFQRALSSLSYERLLRVRRDVEAELAKRRPPPEEVMPS